METRRRPQKASAADISEALRANHGLITRACDWLQREKNISITPSAIRQRVAKSAALQAALDDARACILDKAEARLYEKVDAGENWAVQFILKTLGQSRGYNSQTTVTEMKARFAQDRPYIYADGTSTDDRQRRDDGRRPLTSHDLSGYTPEQLSELVRAAYGENYTVTDTPKISVQFIKGEINPNDNKVAPCGATQNAMFPTSGGN